MHSEPMRLLSPQGFSRQEYWSGLPCPPPGDLPNLGSKPTSLMSPALTGRFFTTSHLNNWQYICILFLQTSIRGPYQKRGWLPCASCTPLLHSFKPYTVLWMWKLCHYSTLNERYPVISWELELDSAEQQIQDFYQQNISEVKLRE